MIGAIGSGLEAQGRSSTHCLFIQLEAVPRPRTRKGYKLKAKSLTVQRLGTAVIQHSDLGSYDRRFMRELAERVRTFQDDQDETETMTIVSLKLAGRCRDVVFAFHHSFRRSRTWLWTPEWSRLTRRALNNNPTKLGELAFDYAGACAKMYKEECAVFRA